MTESHSGRTTARLARAVGSTARETFHSFVATQGSRQASQLAFHLLLAGPAALVFAIWIFSSLGDFAYLRGEVVSEAMSLLPLQDTEGRAEVRQVLERLTDGAGRLGLLTVPVLLFSVSSALSAVRFSVDRANDRVGSGPSFVRSRSSQMLIALAGMPVAVFGAAVVLSGSLGLIFEKVPLFGGLLSSWAGLLGGAAVLSLLLSGLLFVIDRRTSTLKSSITGGVVAALLALAASQGLRLWFAISGGGGPVYGTLAAFIGLLLFAYLFAISIVIGAHVAAAVNQGVRTGSNGGSSPAA